MTVPPISSRRYHPAQAYSAPDAGTTEERLADMADELNRKANLTATPYFSAITLKGLDGLDYLIYVDATGTLQCTPVTL